MAAVGDKQRALTCLTGDTPCITRSLNAGATKQTRVPIILTTNTIRPTRHRVNYVIAKQRGRAMKNVHTMIPFVHH